MTVNRRSFLKGMESPVFRWILACAIFACMIGVAAFAIVYPFVFASGVMVGFSVLFIGIIKDEVDRIFERRSR